MENDKSKETRELGKNELGEISGGSDHNVKQKPLKHSDLIKLMNKPLNLKYGCPPKPNKNKTTDTTINEELNTSPDKDQTPNK